MSGRDAMHDEMPGFFPGRPGGEHDEPLLDMLLERRPIPPGAPPELYDLARLLGAAAGPVEPGDLAGEDAARAAFNRLPSPAGASRAAPRSARHRLTERPARGRLPLAAALAMAAAGLGSATAAYVGALPSPIQHLAHVVIGAPPPPSGAPGQPLGVGSSPTASPSQASSPAPRKTLRVSATPASSKASQLAMELHESALPPEAFLRQLSPRSGPDPAPGPTVSHPDAERGARQPEPGLSQPRHGPEPGQAAVAQDPESPRALGLEPGAVSLGDHLPECPRLAHPARLADIRLTPARRKADAGRCDRAR